MIGEPQAEYRGERLMRNTPKPKTTKPTQLVDCSQCVEYRYFPDCDPNYPCPYHDPLDALCEEAEGADF